MEIRKATLKDLPEIIKLYMLYQKEEEKLKSTDVGRRNLDKKSVLKDIKEFILDKDKIMVVMADGKNILGFLAGSFEKYPDYRVKNIGFIAEVYISPKMRGKGFSSKLKNEFIDWFKKKKCRRSGAVSLYVMPKNKNAIKAYEKWGFKVAYLTMAKKY